METFDDLLYQLHLSYLQARKNKRNTINQLAFEIDQEDVLLSLAEAVYNRTYQPKPSIAFIIHRPVMREVFAADFSDRVIHHFIYRCLNPIVDKKLIYDTYSCRTGKGTLFGIKRATMFMRSCSESYVKKAYVLKLDIEAYFMNMKHAILEQKVVAMLPENKLSFLGISKDTLLYLLSKTIYNPVNKNYHIRGKKSDWTGLPPSKSLFNTPDNQGLPIGNLTSQVFGNIYLNDLDHFIKKKLKVKYYGRYVDDMFFIHNDKRFLESIIPEIQLELHKIGMRLHPNKTVLNPIDEGFLFLGQMIKPYRNYISNRAKNSWYKAIIKINLKLLGQKHFTWDELEEIRSTVNSYLGLLRHSESYSLVKHSMSKFVKIFYLFFKIEDNYLKITIDKNYWKWHYTQNFLHIKQAMIC